MKAKITKHKRTIQRICWYLISMRTTLALPVASSTSTSAMLGMRFLCGFCFAQNRLGAMIMATLTSDILFGVNSTIFFRRRSNI